MLFVELKRMKTDWYQADKNQTKLFVPLQYLQYFKSYKSGKHQYKCSVGKLSQLFTPVALNLIQRRARLSCHFTLIVYFVTNTTMYIIMAINMLRYFIQHHMRPPLRAERSLGFYWGKGILGLRIWCSWKACLLTSSLHIEGTAVAQFLIEQYVLLYYSDLCAAVYMKRT